MAWAENAPNNWRVSSASSETVDSLRSRCSVTHLSPQGNSGATRATMATDEEFMDSPLVTWVRTFNESIDPIDFQDLCDGVYLNDVMLQIDQREAELSASVNRLVKDSNARLQNWTFLLTNIKTYFEESLQQLLVMKRPDIISIVKEPHKESGLQALSQVLLQLLGCAVQCPRKEYYIEIITKLDIHVQEAIVEHIKQITNLPSNAISVDYRLDSDGQFKNFYNILNGVIQERDGYAQVS
ncbi:Protein Daple [Lamellibrachia satsuma]|nr:Protein Daple [Lamellibrachia satsuma]